MPTVRKPDGVGPPWPVCVAAESVDIDLNVAAPGDEQKVSVRWVRRQTGPTGQNEQTGQTWQAGPSGSGKTAARRIAFNVRGDPSEVTVSIPERQGDPIDATLVTATGRLALHGGDGWCADEDTARLVLGDARTLVVVPTAAAFEQPDDALTSAGRWFGDLGLSVNASRVLNRHDANDPARVAEIAAADALLFTGGQPLHLRAVLSESLVWAEIVAAFRRGVPIIAVGASASALSDPMLDPRGGAFTLGLGLVPGFAVLPGTDGWSDDRKTRTLRLAGRTPLAMVPSATTLLRDPHGRWSSAGPNAVTFVGLPG